MKILVSGAFRQGDAGSPSPATVFFRNRGIDIVTKPDVRNEPVEFRVGADGTSGYRDGTELPLPEWLSRIRNSQQLRLVLDAHDVVPTSDGDLEFRVRPRPLASQAGALDATDGLFVAATGAKNTGACNAVGCAAAGCGAVGGGGGGCGAVGCGAAGCGAVGCATVGCAAAGRGGGGCAAAGCAGVGCGAAGCGAVAGGGGGCAAAGCAAAACGAVLCAAAGCAAVACGANSGACGAAACALDALCAANAGWPP